MHLIWWPVLIVGVSLVSCVNSEILPEFGHNSGPDVLHDQENSKDNHEESVSTAEKFITSHSQHRLSSNFLLSLYQNLSLGLPLSRATGRHQHQRFLKRADTVRAFPAVGSLISHHHLLYKFNLSQVEKSEILRAAEIHFLPPSGFNVRRKMYVASMSFEQDGLVYASSPHMITPSTTNEGLVIVDATKAVKDWLEQFARNEQRLLNEITLDLAVATIGHRRAFSHSKLLRHVGLIYESGEGFSKDIADVILVTYSETGNRFLNASLPGQLSGGGRQKRSNDGHRNAKEDEENDKKSGGKGNGNFICKRKDLIVNFPELGWGKWVVYPTLFNAYQCTGKCGGFADSRNNPTNHAIIQGLVRLVSRRDMPISCCTPTKLSPLSILYWEKQSVVIKHHEDIIAEECGCL